MAKYLLLLFTIVFFSNGSNANHILGGEITWSCQGGGDYVFKLVFYRDCNEADINTVNQTLNVINHPTVNTITVNFDSRVDLSPFCTEVAGGPIALDCGAGAFGGNGPGAIEKAVYISNPINLPGVPPAAGWIFTYESTFRSSTTTNITAPPPTITGWGITIEAKMFPIPGTTGGCIDNSPQFLQDPYFVSCSGSPYDFNMNSVDPDLDSLNITFGNPLDQYSTYGAYNPPANPASIPFETGFSVNSPTPGVSMNPGNIPAQLNPSSGDLNFLSNNTGEYIVKMVCQSFRNGILIGQVERDIVLFIMACSGSNTAPTINGPFAGLFETTINAGDPVNFNITSTDIELLQDGTPQDNILTSTGLMYGNPITSNGGCLIGPCATLNTAPPITGVQGVTATFDWQTSCDHLVSPTGYAADMVPYHFVFKVQDNYCSVPKVTYATVTINVLNPGVIQAPEIDCIQSNAAGDVTINWTAVNDPNGTFMGYDIYSIQNGLVGSVANINTTTFTDPGAGLAVNDYFLAVNSGCNGNTTRFSDSLKNIYLDVTNPSNGTAVLQWNDPLQPPRPGMNDYYHIYREYPAGSWTLMDSVPYGTTNYIDTIDICSAWLNYQIVLPDQNCDHMSNIDGDNFEDMITPDIPIISSVTIDTATNLVTIQWNQNGQEDTYGYVIYLVDQSGVPIEIDTVWGLTSTTYNHIINTDVGPLTYSVAAFDSCWTANVPATYQTSAKAELHTTNFVESTLNICDRTVDLYWSGYVGWNNVAQYYIYSHKQGETWSLLDSTSGTGITINVDPDETYCFVIEAVSDSSDRSFSNVSCIYIAVPTQPDYNYLQVATVSGDKVDVRYMVDNSSNITEAILERQEVGEPDFEVIETIPLINGAFSYTDSTEIDVFEHSYIYRVAFIDSCGRNGAYSNQAQTMLLTLMQDEVRKINYLNWNPYQTFDGNILAYNVYRGIDGNFSGAPIASLPNYEYYFEDDVNGVSSNGKICYKVEAVESVNIYGFSERSFSNEACAVLVPIIYIPNAFMPDGINKTFRPVVSDFDMSSYQFTIFSRWGEVMFRSNDPIEGWGGEIRDTGKMASNDTYLYMLEIRDGNGIEIIRRGHVSIIK